MLNEIYQGEEKKELENQITNTATVAGVVQSEMEFSHEVYGEGFYSFFVSVPRLSEAHDIIPVTVSERLISPDSLAIGDNVVISGQFRSYNNYSDTGSKLVLTLFAREITFGEAENQTPNEIILTGFICKPVVYRHTPFGREIADILLAVNRSYNKSDYIPCIAWGRNARFCQNLEVGSKVKLTGRIQSREYKKRVSDDEFITKTAYEVSVVKLEEIDMAVEA
ncbi:MAG: single-stranded DNA-binding protein [Clostridia bacterium]|nr:single-stranded DNA-binding protein [Clostridia bacterium]